MEKKGEKSLQPQAFEQQFLKYLFYYCYTVTSTEGLQQHVLLP